VGLDAGADTIGWQLTHDHGVAVSRATINRILTRAEAIVPDPSKRPRFSYTRFDRIAKSGTVTLCVDGSATSASDEPTPEPTSSCSSTTSKSASSTPPPANSSASSPSTQHRTTSPETPNKKAESAQRRFSCR
jgi:hypothetical protein